MSHRIGQIKQNHRQSNSNPSQNERDSPKLEAQTLPSVPTLSDADYEFLFNQLLEGIAHGWHDRRIVKFFIQLGDRTEQRDWVAWLDRLRLKASTLPLQSRHQLGTMMIRLGELTRSTAEANKIGAASERVGRELLFDKVSTVWEYVGSDLPAKRQPTKSRSSARLPADLTLLDLHVEQAARSPEPESKLNLIKDYQRSDSTIESDVVENIDANLPEDNLSIDEATISSSISASSDMNHLHDKKNHNEELNLPDRESEQLDKSASLVDSESIADTKPRTDEIWFSAESEPPSPMQEGLELDTSVGDTKSDPNSNGKEIEAIDIDRVMNLIQEDEELARQISQKLKLTTTKSQIASPKLARSSLELIESWFNLGLKQVSAGELTKAIASWEKALNINPNLSEAWHNRGSAFGRLGNYQAAIESFENALAIDPLNYQAWNDRAHALYQVQNWAEAVNSWDNAIKNMPGNHLFWYNRACALEQLGKWDEAIASHEKALEIKPDFEPGRSRYINLVADNSRSN